MPKAVPVTIDRPEGEASFLVEAYEEDGRIVCGVIDLKGKRRAGPKAFARAIREEMAKLERVVKSRGAQEIRFAGRWARILTDYEPFPAPAEPSRRRKLL